MTLRALTDSEPVFDMSNDAIDRIRGGDDNGGIVDGSLGIGGGEPELDFLTGSNLIGSNQSASLSGTPGGPEHIQLIDNGSSDNRIDLWFVGDGYTIDQRQDLIDDVMEQFAEITTTGILASPFDRYAEFFNVHVLFQASPEAGADRPADGHFVDTAFDASYSYGGNAERCLYFDTFKANAAINAVRPGDIDVDLRLGSINTSQYGGCGGSYAVYAARNSGSTEIARHEVAHSFADLADEYSVSSDTYSGPEPHDANVTTDPTGAKWAHWHGFDDGVLGPIGAYEGGVYVDFGVYRPTRNSKLRSLDRPFDAVAKEQFILEFYNEVDPLDSWSFQGFETTVTDPAVLTVDTIDPDVISTEWFLGTTLIQSGGESLDVAGLNLANGVYEISVDAFDDTDLVRINLDQLSQTVTWIIEIARDFILVEGSAGSDTLTGSAEAEELYGFDDADVLIAAGGADTLFGGSGDDTLDGGAGADVFEGDGGFDLVTFASEVAGHSFVISSSSIAFGEGEQSFAEAINNIEAIEGTNFDDVLDGSSLTDGIVLAGGAGSDVLLGGAGDDVLVADAFDAALIAG